MKVAGALALSMLAASLFVPVQAQGQEPRVAITSPEEGGYAKGLTQIRVAVEPEGAVSSVVFTADGTQLCTVTTPPFVCDWDAGSELRAHQVRVVATLAAGGRVVRTVQTSVIENMFSVSVDTVEVLASVMNGSRPIRGLQQSAFRVFEDDVPQTVVQFAGEDDLPLELVVAVDLSTSVSAALPVLKQAVKSFLGSVSERDRITLLGFNERVFTVSRRESEVAVAAAAVDKLAASGHTRLYDAILNGLDLLDKQSGRRALVVFTDGEDEGSRATIQSVEARLRRSESTLFMIGAGRGNESVPLQKLMRRLAEPTGGLAVFEEKMENLQRAFAAIRTELSGEYLLGYVSTNEKKDGSWRRVRVEVDARGKVRARDGYQAPGK